MTATRNRILPLATFALLLAASFAVRWDSTPARAAETPQGGPTEAVLAPGGYLQLPDGTRLTFTDVASDSRCPKDVVCIWAGNVALAFGLETADGGTSDFEVTYEGQPATETVEGYAVTVMDVQPYPVSTQPIEPEDYRVTVRIGSDREQARIITEADFGGAVEVTLGQRIIVDPGGDSIWRATADDPNVLEPLPQIAIFPPPPPAFEAVGRGTTALFITEEPPCRYAMPPCLVPQQIFKVQVIVR